jgi:hypothetical protein
LIIDENLLLKYRGKRVNSKEKIKDKKGEKEREKETDRENEKET